MRECLPQEPLPMLLAGMTTLRADGSDMSASRSYNDHELIMQNQAANRTKPLGVKPESADQPLGGDQQAQSLSGTGD